MFVQHVVFFRVSDGAPAELVREWLDSLRSLAIVPGIFHLAAAEARCAAQGFTHLLHARFLDRASLDRYSVDPRHLAVIELGNKICEQKMAIDWLDSRAPAQIRGGAMRAGFVKPRRSHEFLDEFLVSIDESPGAVFASAGFNFNQGRAKHFDLGYIIVLDDPKHLDENIQCLAAEDSLSLECIF